MKMFKFLIKAIISLQFLTSFLFASGGTLSGKITLANEKTTIDGIQILLVEKKFYTATDRNGNFSIRNVQPGVYTLEISFVGYKKQRVNVEVLDSVTTPISLTLQESPFQLNEVVVTGSLTKHLLKDSPVITEIVSRKEIEQTGSSNLSDVLKSHTGIELGTSIGQTQNARLQGLNKNHVLILVDGERITGKVDDAIDLGQIPVNMIEKIEVVKGPLSATYGSEALGGVINIITKSPEDAPLLYAAITGGANGRQDYELSTAHSFQNFLYEGFKFSLMANVGWNKYFGITHYDSTNSFDGIPESDRKNFDLKIALAPSSKMQMDVKMERYFDYMIWKGTSNDYYDTKTKATNDKSSIVSTLNYQPTETSNLKLSALTSRNIHGSLKVTNTKSEFDKNDATENLTTLKGVYSFNPYSSSLLAVGAEHNIEELISGRLLNNERKIRNTVAFVEDEWTIHTYTLTFGGRYSHNSAFGNFFAPRISFRWNATDKLTLRGSYGRGYRAPSFIELYFDFNHSSIGYIVEGEPHLQPETSHGFNIGIDYSRNDWLWFRTNFYYNTVKNLIEDYQKNPSTMPGFIVLSYRNISEAITAGSDIDVDIVPATDVKISFGYHYTYAVDGKGNVLLFRVPQVLSLKALYEMKETGTSVSLRGRWQDKVLIDDQRQNANTVNGTASVTKTYSPSYTVFDTKITQTLFHNISLNGGINNILDKTIYPYGQKRGREFYVGIQFQL